MLATCRDTARPGVKECEVYAAMMQAMLANGGEEPTLFLWAADRYPYPHPFRVPTMRPLEKGDMIICEMHPKFGGYFTHVERTFCLGEPEPSSSTSMRPASPPTGAASTVQSRQENLHRDGCGASDEITGSRLRHLRGRHPRPRPGLAGISALPPPCDRRRPRSAQGDRRRFEPGMVFAMNIDLFDPKWRHGETGCVFAETIEITPSG